MLFFAGWAFLLARFGVILKDVTPIIRLFLQAAFWATPIVYAAGERTLRFFIWNPIYAPLELHRFLLFGAPGSGPLEAIPWLNGFFLFFLISLVLYYFSSRRISEIVADHM